MAGRPRSVSESRVFDVSKPNKSKPMGTSRPVIVNHGSMVKDNTVNEGKEEKIPRGSPSVTRKTITPITVDDTRQNNSEKTAPVVEDAPMADEKIEILPTKSDEKVEPEAQSDVVAPEKSSEEEIESPETDDTAQEEQSDAKDIDPPASDSANVDALAEVTEKKKNEAKEAEEQARRDAALQGLIDSKQYIVPIAHDSGKGGHRGLWVLFIIILLAAGAYAAIDAGAIDVGIELPYHFF
jgi:hypothetical protein